ncbi:MAG: ribosome biogenesis GTP-binding protein YihA/YsxC [Syntrophobacteria bacterium]
MVIRSARFVCSAVAPDQYPSADLPEIAFAGRSNVGKSSLINTLLRRKKLVRTSKQPGCTQLINFFEVNGRWRFVDLPGYGYARVPEAVRKRWRPMVETYLKSRDNLRGIVFIVDVRRIPSVEDLTLWQWLHSGNLAVITVLTKVDKLSRNQRGRQVSGIAGELHTVPQAFVEFSAVSGEGRDALWQALLPVLEAERQ